jgi:signal peptidase I
VTHGDRNPEPAAETPGARGSVTLWPGRGWLRRSVIALLAALVILTGVRVFVADVYTVHQVSMSPTLADAERIVVDKRYPGEGGAAAGDIVVFDGTGSFAPYEEQGSTLSQVARQVGHWFGIGAPPQTYVKRVIGVGGDKVSCCDAEGRLVVNDSPAAEPYLSEPATASSPASRTPFEVEVPPGRMWVMGDNREESVDSRALLGAPGGGMISQDRIVGEATTVFWPWDHRRTVEENAR